MEPEDIKPVAPSKYTVRPRVIIAFPDPKVDAGQRTIYAAGFIEGYGGRDILVDLPMGMHEFSREDGTWRCGDCLNYKDARILDIETIEASIKAGYGGSIEDYRKSLPMCAAS